MYSTPTEKGSMKPVINAVNTGTCSSFIIDAFCTPFCRCDCRPLSTVPSPLGWPSPRRPRSLVSGPTPGLTLCMDWDSPQSKIYRRSVHVYTTYLSYVIVTHGNLCNGDLISLCSTFDIRLLKRLASKKSFSIGTVYLNICKIYDLLYLPIHVIVIRDWMYWCLLYM